MTTPESRFKRKLIERLESEFPGAVILKTNASLIQGIPDQLILYGPHWAAFEVKRSEKASRRPNQEAWVDILNQMSFASFVYPENERWFLNEIQRSFHTKKHPRISIRV